MMDEYTRDPCPWRVFDDAGGAFLTGAIGTTIFNSIKGFRNAPSPFSSKMLGSLTAIKERGRITASYFGLWGVVFTTIDCSLVNVRKKEDPWNIIISGAITGGILSVRRGLPAVVASTLLHGLLFSLLGGGLISYDHFEVLSTPQAAVYDDPSVLGRSQKSK